MLSEEFEDVLVIRVQRPAGIHREEEQTITIDVAARMGEEFAATQTVAAETAEYAFTEELSIAWWRVEEIAQEVLAGRRDLGGMTPGERRPREATDADR